MSKKKKKHSSSQVAFPSTPANPPLPTPEAFSRQISFDSMEDRIRGEEKIREEENLKLKEGQDVKKKLESVEVERRLEELKAQLGINAGTQRRKDKKR
jgi:hypothetical protein